MSEHPVVDHGMRSYKIWKDPAKTFRHKLRDIFIEMMIIVFAVLITLFFERLREHQQDTKIKAAFLKGYKADLLKDIKELTSDTGGLHNMNVALIKLWDAKNYSEDSILKLTDKMGQSIEFTPNDSRFEALKAAGKLTAIDNAELLTAMFNLYQKEIPYLRYFGTGSFNAYRMQQIQPFLDQNLIHDERGHVTNWKTVLQMNTMRNYIMYSIGKNYEMRSRYLTVIKSYRQILQIVDAEEKK